MLLLTYLFYRILDTNKKLDLQNEKKSGDKFCHSVKIEEAMKLVFIRSTKQVIYKISILAMYLYVFNM